MTTNQPTQEQLDQWTEEANQLMKTRNLKKLPPNAVDDLFEKGARRCSKCTKVQKTTNFTRRLSNRHGLYSWCHTCNAEHVATWKSENPEANQESRKQWYRRDNNKLKSRLRAGYLRAVKAECHAEWITPEHLLTYWEAVGINPWESIYSGTSLNVESLGIDHKIPLCAGGTHTVDNLVPCTKAENSTKNRKHWINMLNNDPVADRPAEVERALNPDPTRYTRELVLTLELPEGADA